MFENNISPSDLRRTSLSDQNWLGILQEQIYSDVLSDEFYQLLQTPWVQVIDSDESKENEILKAKRTLISEKEQEIFIKFLLQEHPKFLFDETVNLLYQKMSVNSTGGELFSSSLKKRIEILKRSHLAALRERARQKLLPEGDDDTEDLKVSQTPVIVRLTIRMFLTTLRMQNNAQVIAMSVSSLSAMVAELPPLSLYYDPEDCLNSLEEFLLSLIYENKKNDNEKELSPTTPRRLKTKENEEDKKSKKKHRNYQKDKKYDCRKYPTDTVEALVGLSIARGSLLAILTSVKVLLESFQNSLPFGQTELKIGKYIHNLANWKMNFSLSPICNRFQSCTWGVIWTEDKFSALPESIPTEISPTMTTDGFYIFLHNSFGLMKIGSGYGGTIRGRVYSRRAEWHTKFSGSITCVGDNLYFRSPSIFPVSILVLNKDLQKVGTILQNGNGTIKSQNHENIITFAPEKEPPQIKNEIGNSNTETVSGRSNMISDGRYIYIISHIVVNTSKFVVNCFDPVGFALLYTVELNYKEHLKGNRGASPLHTEISLTNTRFYTNGSYIYCIILPPDASCYGYKVVDTICRCFCLKDGSLVSTDSLEETISVSATCYDVINNVIWSFDEKKFEVTKYFNEGLAPKHTPLRIEDQSLETHRMQDVEIPKEKISEKQAIQCILAVLSKLAILSMPRTTSIYHKCHLREPFVVEVKSQVFHLLLHLLTITHKRVIEHEDDRLYYLSLIIFFLRILNVNIHRMVLFKISPQSVCLTSSDMGHDALGELRDMLLMFDSDSWVPNSAAELAPDLKRIQLEACETLTFGFELFYPNHTLQSRVVLNLLSLQAHKSKKKAHEGFDVLLIQLLDLLTNHPNPSYLLHPEEDTPLDPHKALYPMVTQLFDIIFTADESAIVHTRQQILDYPMLKVGISAPSLQLLFAMQKNLVLRVLENDASNANIVQVFISFAQLIFRKCTELLQGTAESVTISVGKTIGMKSSSSVMVLRTLLTSLVQALFLFTSNTAIAFQLLPHVIKLISVLDMINFTSSKKPSVPTLERSLSKEYLRGRSKISETPHPYPGYCEITDIVTFPGSTFLSLTFDVNCQSKDENDVLILFADDTLTKPIYKYHGDNFPQNKVVIAGDTVAFLFKSNHFSSSWGYRCQVTGYMSRTIVKEASWSVELEKTLCSLGGRLAASLIRGKVISPEETNILPLFSKPVFSNRLEDKFTKQFASIVSEVKIETPRGLYESASGKSFQEPIFNIVEERCLLEMQEFCDDICENKGGAGTAFADNILGWLDNHEIEKDAEPHIKIVLRHMIAVILKHNGILKEIIPKTSMKDSKTPKKGVNKKFTILQNISKQISGILRQFVDTIVELYSLHPSPNEAGSFIMFLEEKYSKNFIAPRKIFDNVKSDDLRTHCSNIVKRLQLLLKFAAPQNDSLSDTINIATTPETLQILEFMTNDSLPLDQILKVIHSTCERTIGRAFGLLKMKEMLESINFKSMKNEILCFLGPSLRGSDSACQQHYLDIECCSEASREKIASSFEELMSLCSSFLIASTGDHELEVLVLDSFLLSFKEQDHNFLYSVDIFGILSKLFLSSSPRVSSAAIECFQFLGAMCFGLTNHKSVTPLQQSFFDLAASQLEDYCTLQNVFAKISDISKVPIYEILSKSHLASSDPNIQRLVEKMQNIISLLCTISASDVAKKCLATPRYIRIFLYLLIVGNEKIKLYAFRLLQNVLPMTSGDIKIDKYSLVSTLFLILGSVLEIKYPINLFNIDSTPLLLGNVLLPMNPRNIDMTIDHSQGNLNRAPKGSRLELSHPFFPVFDSNIVLPSGWDRNDAKISEKIEFLFSNDNRTVSLMKLNPESESSHITPGVIRANLPIPTSLRLFYFEVRIENATEGKYLFVGLISSKGKDKSSFTNNNLFAYNRCGMTVKHPSILKYPFVDTNEYSIFENEYGPSFTTDDVIGCGLDMQSRFIYFTKNGEYLGPAFRNIQNGVYYPLVGANAEGSSFLVNFGQMPFRYDPNKFGQSDRSSIITYTHSLFIFETAQLLRNLCKTPQWEESIRKEMKDTFDSFNFFFDLKKRKKRRVRKTTRYYYKVLTSFTILGAPLSHWHLGAKVIYTLHNKIDAVVTEVNFRTNTTTIAYYQDSDLTILSVPTNNLQVDILSYPFLKLFDDADCLLRFETIMQNIYASFNTSILSPNSKLPHQKSSPLSLSKTSPSQMLLSPVHDSMDELAFLSGDIIWMQLFLFGVKFIATSLLASSGKKFFDTNLLRTIITLAQHSRSISKLNTLQTTYLFLYLQQYYLFSSPRLLNIVSSPSNETLYSMKNLRNPSKDTINNNINNSCINNININNINNNNNNNFTNSEVLHGSNGEVFEIGKLYLIGKIGKGTEWIREMNKTVGYYGEAVEIDYRLKLVLISFLHKESVSQVKYWYSYDLLIPCEQSLEYIPHNNLVSLKPTVVSMIISECKQIILSSLSLIQSNTSTYLTKKSSLAPLKLFLQPDNIFSNFNIVHYIKYTFSNFYSFFAKMVLCNREKVPQALLVLQNFVYSLLKNDVSCNSEQRSDDSPERSSRNNNNSLSNSTGSNNLSNSTGSNNNSNGNLSDLSNSSSSSSSTSSSTPMSKSAFSARSFSDILVSNNNIEAKIKKKGRQSLCSMLINASLENLEGKVALPYLLYDSPHPYPPNTVIKELISVPNANGLLITFDPQTHIKCSTHVLTFYSTGFETHRKIYASYCGKGVGLYPPLLIENVDKIWLEFTTDNTGSEWGYRFKVQAISMKFLDYQLISKPQIECGLYIIDWMMDLTPVWVKDFYSKDLYQQIFLKLCLFLQTEHSLHRKLMGINTMTRFIRRVTSSDIDLYALHFLKSDLFAHIKQQQKSGIYSVLIQRLAELIINIEIRLASHDDTDDDDDDVSIELAGNQTALFNKQKYKSIKEPGWFYHAVNATRAMKHLLDGDPFPHDFIKHAFYQAHITHIVQESPHPYPSGVRVTATVHVPNATRLLITFDAKSVIESGYDHLMFSRHIVGADDLGGFTGDFGGKQFYINGNFFIWSFLSDSSGNDNAFWGFRFTVTPYFPDEINNELMDKILVDYQKTLSTLSDWNISLDYELIKFIEKVCEKKAVLSSDIQWNDFEFRLIPGIALPLDSVRIRFFLLKHFNYLLSNLSPLVDMRYVTENWSIAYMIGKIRRLIFADLQHSLLSDQLFATSTHRTIPMITLNRHFNHGSCRSFDRKLLLSKSLFLQGFHQLHYLEASMLRSNDRAFAVKLVQEGATDVGGPYREIISEFCSEVVSPFLNLFISCPNGRDEVGYNRDKYIPNPTATSSFQLQLFAFVGQLMGIAIRTKNYLNISLPSIIWKPLVGLKVNVSDLEDIDSQLISSLNYLKNCEENGINSDLFDSIFEGHVFTATSSDGRTVDVKRNGKSIAVTWENRLKYVKCVERYRCNEFKLQIEAMSKGIASIIPFPLSYLNWPQLEERVCGCITIDLKLLKSRTIYRGGLSENDTLISNFWKTLENFTEKEKQLLLRFVWGRSNLPRESEFNTPFIVQLLATEDKDQDKYLPIAQTCFFVLSLPEYSTIEILRERLLYAITTCKEIDTDFIASEN